MRHARLLALLLLLVAGPALAHEFSITDVVAELRADGTYRIDVLVDVDALALGVSPRTDSAEVAAELRALPEPQFQAAVERAKGTLVRRLRVRFDGQRQRPLVRFPGPEATPAGQPKVPSVLGIVARLEGSIPDGARELTFGASRTFNVVRFTLRDRTTGAEVNHLLRVAEDSPPHVIGGPLAAAGRVEVIGRYLLLGFEHILPRGIDHILFVLGLFLLSTKLRPLLWQVSAFTVAHTLTLALAMYGVVSLPSRIVEPLIALSIAYVAVENLATTKLTPWRTAVVFGFGLLHGLGFAGVLRELGHPPGEFLTSLVSFNVGVELGQLAVIALAALAVGWLRHRPAYRRVVVVPASAAIALVGLYWALGRALGAG